jgi:DNA topoisomerase-1
MTTLLIVESPAKAKTIEKYLGKEYIVRASVGHIRDLPKSNKKAIDIEKGFIPNYEPLPTKERVLHELRTLSKKASAVLLATDPDREGEAIAWHLAEVLGLDGKKTNRITFHEITKEAVGDALHHPRPIDQNLRKAQEARRVLDRLVGYDLSGLLWKKVRYGLSAGRVQSPALRIIMEREREIRAFIPETYWTLTALLSQKGEKIQFTCSQEPRDEKEAEQIVRKGKEGLWQVSRIEEKEQVRNPYPPFTTSTLQQSASTRLGFSPANTMRIAQKLYEAGHITYMRTDSTNLSKQALGALAHTIEKKYGAEEVAIRHFTKKAKNAQEAHEAIRPTHPEIESVGSTDEQQKLYQLIRTRALASQMRSATVMKTRIEASCSAIPPFIAHGSRITSLGWLKEDTRARGEDVELPRWHEGDTLSCEEILSEKKETTPPNRYTEAGLIKELEKRGIGRPSTYATIMKNLADREYVTKQGKTLIPTPTGDVVSSFLETHFPSYISDSFTAEMERGLDDIAVGTRDYTPTLSEFYIPFSKIVHEKETLEKVTNLGDAPSEYTCPLCGKSMIYKLGKNGKFMSCSTFPDCKGVRTEIGEVIKERESLGIYPPTGGLIFVREGRFGPYVEVSEQEEVATKKKKKTKPRRASIPKEKRPDEVTLADALHYLSLPRTLGTHPETGKTIEANIGRFGPYIVHDGDFRSLKTDDVYTISLSRALEIVKEEKKKRFAKKRITK